MAFYIKRNDTSPILNATLKDGDGAAVDLAGTSVALKMKAVNDTSLKVDSACTIVDASNGKVRYTWAATDTNTRGSYQAEFQVTYSGGAIETFPNDGYVSIIITDDLS